MAPAPYDMSYIIYLRTPDLLHQASLDLHPLLHEHGVLLQELPALIPRRRHRQLCAERGLLQVARIHPGDGNKASFLLAQPPVGGSQGCAQRSRICYNSTSTISITLFCRFFFPLVDRVIRVCANFTHEQGRVSTYRVSQL